jgi:hypothetical protein
MKDRDLTFLTEHVGHHATPEQLLWLAVIDRALVDYIKFYDTLHAKHRRSLDWFLFEDDSVPNNLVYICEQLFNDVDVVKNIRKRAVALAKGYLPQQEIDDYKRKRYSLRVKSKYY